MKKVKPRPIPPQLIPRRKKDMERLAANPAAIKAIIEMNKSAAEVLEKQKTQRALTAEEWLERSFAILPEDFDTDEVKNKIRSCFTTETKEA